MSTNLTSNLGLDPAEFIDGIDTAKKSMEGLKNSAEEFRISGVMKLATALKSVRTAFTAVSSVISPVNDKLMGFSKAAKEIEFMASALKTFAGSASLAQKAIEQDTNLDIVLQTIKDACLTTIKDVIAKTGEILENRILSVHFEKGDLVDNTEALGRLTTALVNAKLTNDGKKKEVEGTKKDKKEGATNKSQSSTPPQQQNKSQASTPLQQQNKGLYTKDQQLMDNLNIQRAIGNSQLTKAVRLQTEVEMKQLIDKWIDAGYPESEAGVMATEEMKQTARSRQAMTRANSQNRMNREKGREEWKKIAGQTDAQKEAWNKLYNDPKYKKGTELEKSNFRQQTRQNLKKQIKDDKKQKERDDSGKKEAKEQKSPIQTSVESIKKTLEEVKSAFDKIVEELQLA